MEKVLKWLPERPQPLVIRYGVTAVLVVACFLLLLFVEAITGVTSFFLMYPAVFLGALLFDRGSGFLAAALGTVLLIVSIQNGGGYLPPSPYWLPLALFLAIALALAALSEALRKGWERAVEAERAKDLLYRELAHRTKNDFAMAASMLGLQARSQQSPEAKRALMTAVGRLQVLGKAHDQFQPGEGEQVQMRAYLEALCQSLSDSMSGGSVQSLTVTCDEIELPSARAVPVGLIVNELVTNTYKHAFFEGEQGAVRVSLRRGEGCSLLVEDNGKGCPDGAASGLGSQLVTLLVGQLDGTLERTSADPGCRVRVNFPEQSQSH
jgi:two-component system, sensor histidine kinase PdtaS